LAHLYPPVTPDHTLGKHRARHEGTIRLGGAEPPSLAHPVAILVRFRRQSMRRILVLSPGLQCWREAALQKSPDEPWLSSVQQSVDLMALYEGPDAT